MYEYDIPVYMKHKKGGHFTQLLYVKLKKLSLHITFLGGG